MNPVIAANFVVGDIDVAVAVVLLDHVVVFLVAAVVDIGSAAAAVADTTQGQMVRLYTYHDDAVAVVAFEAVGEGGGGGCASSNDDDLDKVSAFDGNVTHLAPSSLARH